MTSSRASISGNTAKELLENCASNVAEALRLLLNEENAQSGGRSTRVPSLPIPITPRPNTAGTHTGMDLLGVRGGRGVRTPEGVQSGAIFHDKAKKTK